VLWSKTKDSLPDYPPLVPGHNLRRPPKCGPGTSIFPLRFGLTSKTYARRPVTNSALDSFKSVVCEVEPGHHPVLGARSSLSDSSNFPQHVGVAAFHPSFRDDCEGVSCRPDRRPPAQGFRRAFSCRGFSRTYRRIPAYPSMEDCRWRSRAAIRLTISSAVGTFPESSAAKKRTRLKQSRAIRQEIVFHL